MAGFPRVGALVAAVLRKQTKIWLFSNGIVPAKLRHMLTEQFDSDRTNLKIAGWERRAELH
jgi:hypothetical protein